jgi:hypothetical protein
MKKIISIIIPIFSLEKDRLTNFLFVCKELSRLKNKINIIVAEQLSNNAESKIVEYLKIYPHINHIKLQIGDVFNKSILINRAFEKTDTEFIWIVDADFYTNYELVLKSIKPDNEFIRPFSETIELTSSETDTLLKTKYAKIERDEYSSSSANGKYSFIVKSEIFKRSGMMNENFMGWGFQDLDFVENRLILCDIANIDILGLHLYHPVASRDHVNENKLIYMGIKTSHEVGDTPSLNRSVNKKETPVDSKPLKKQNLDGIKKNEPTNLTTSVCRHIHVSYNDFISSVNLKKNIHVIKPSKHKQIQRDMTGRMKTSEESTNFLYYYINFIYTEYETLTSDFLFSNDYFLKNPLIYDSNIKNLIANSDVSTTTPPGGFVWLGVETKPKASQLNGAEYDEFVRTYLHSIKIYRKDFNPAGNFVVSTKSIKLNSREFYKKLLDSMRTWSSTEYEFLLISLKNIFIDN